MSLPTRSRTNLRQDVLKLIDPAAYPIASTVTALSNLTTEIRDSVLAPVGQVEDLATKWIYASTQPPKENRGARLAGAPEPAGPAVGGTDETVFNVGDGI